MATALVDTIGIGAIWVCLGQGLSVDVLKGQLELLYGAMFDITVSENDKSASLVAGPDRWKDRSRTYQGIAEAMAEQWGGDLLMFNFQ